MIQLDASFTIYVIFDTHKFQLIEAKILLEFINSIKATFVDGK